MTCKEASLGGISMLVLDTSLEVSSLSKVNSFPGKVQIEEEDKSEENEPGSPIFHDAIMFTSQV